MSLAQPKRILVIKLRQHRKQCVATLAALRRAQHHIAVFGAENVKTSVKQSL